MTALLILGAGGHAKVVAETATASGRFDRISFVDDRWREDQPQEGILGYPLIGPLSRALAAETLGLFSSAIVAIGDAKTRLHWIHELQSFGYELPALIHPTAWVSPTATVAMASVIFAHAVVQAEATIGIGSILNTGCSVDHDAKLADGVHICPGTRIAGEVTIGPRSWIGVGACVIQQIQIGSDVMVGAGAAVVSDLCDGVTAVGVPARRLRHP